MPRSPRATAAGNNAKTHRGVRGCGTMPRSPRATAAGNNAKTHRGVRGCGTMPRPRPVLKKLLPMAFTEAWVRTHFEECKDGAELFVDEVIGMATQTPAFRNVAEQTLRSQLRQCFQSQLKVNKRKASHGQRPHFVGVKRRVVALAHERHQAPVPTAALEEIRLEPQLAAGTGRQAPADERPADSPAAVARGDKLQITSTVSRPFTCPICYDDVEKGG